MDSFFLIMVPLATAIFGLVFWLVVIAARSKKDTGENPEQDSREKSTDES